jgi:signal transduction histidine kinase
MALSVLTFLSIGTVLTEASQTSVGIINWVFIAATSLLLAIVFFKLFGALIDKYLSQSIFPRTFFIATLFFSTEMLRAIYVGEIALIQGFVLEMDWGFRVVAGGFTGLLFFGMLSIVLNDRAVYVTNLAELKNVENQLRRTSAVTEEDIERNKQSILNTIRDAVNQALHTVIAEPENSKKNSRLIVDELVRVSEEVVRPLSHKLFSEKFELDQSIKTLQIKRWRTSEIFALATTTNPFQPGTTAIIGILQLLGITLFDTGNPVRGLASLTVFIVWIYLILAIAKKLFAPAIQKSNLLVRFVLITLVYSAVALFPLLSPNFAAELGMHFDPGFYLYLAAVASSLLWLLALYAATDVARRQTLANTAKLNEELSWSAARLGAQLWNQKQKLAHIIHKDIQGALISSALKFKNEVNAGVAPNVAVIPISELIADTAELVYSFPDLADLNQEVKKLNELWDGIFNISMQIPDSTHQQILADPICHQVLIDLIGEFVTNAVKHGKATEGRIDVTNLQSDVIQLVMQNNGIPVDEDFKPGLGTEMVLQNCLTSEFDNLPDQGVIFTATIPVN